ncbi:MAG: DUF1902 domain-containing protein, partial [Zoogloeaceae bacterium]|nr:DUF1902 domain-containing protein [Zoogloeaceae bacterium]
TLLEMMMMWPFWCMSVFRMPRPCSFEVTVTCEDGGYIAECEKIGLVTEADTYESLIERAWEIAPEMAELNGFSFAPGDMSLTFRQTQEQPQPA